MPPHIRRKLGIIIFLSILSISGIFYFSFWWGALTLVLALLYVEMIYPKWNFFGPAILKVSATAPTVAITFDDGPSEWTLPILDSLKNENIKATFFLLGINVDRHPEIARRIEAEGHAIGYHGYSHTKFHFKSLKFIQADLDRCVLAFEKAGLSPKKLIRFPHGFKNIFAVCEIKLRGWTLCGWGRGVWDSKRPGVDLIVSRSLQLKGGEILLLHDGDGAKEKPDRSQTAEAILRIIQGLKNKGFQFTTLS
jgi:peptidoglycan/xylan/chitin deacetylase (PgdA/CDA1 family)